ncbi:glycosyltransferase [Candidatus Microgenomates bacterium]|nr:MAG: glycosyltransferase [Candidatus Microgenomates bacterium]
MKIKVSVIIVNYNGLKWLKKCLTSLSQQSYDNYEIIFVDNASSDGSVLFVKRHFPKVKLVRLQSNSGFAKGNNEGYKISKGEYLILLNNDTCVPDNFIQKFITAFDNPKVGIAQAKLILMSDGKSMDSCGSFWTQTTLLYHFGNGKDSILKKYNKALKIFSVKGAAMMVRRGIVESVGLFDPDFWSYYEETDLCHRVWISGYECWYWPAATCFHAQGGTSRTLFGNKYSLIQYHNFKNKIMSYVKNFEVQTLIYVLPTALFVNFIIATIWLFQGKYRYSMSIIRAWVWNVKHLSSNLKKRKKIQMARIISDEEIMSQVMRLPRSLAYYYYLFTDNISQYED